MGGVDNAMSCQLRLWAFLDRRDALVVPEVQARVLVVQRCGTLSACLETCLRKVDPLTRIVNRGMRWLDGCRHMNPSVGFDANPWTAGCVAISCSGEPSWEPFSLDS